MLITYHNAKADLNVLETALKTFRWEVLRPEQMAGRRATCKVENFVHFCEMLQVEHDRVFVADADLYFVGDPFKAFDEFGPFDVGLTTRGYKFWAPINGGVMYFRINLKTICFLQEHLRQVHNPTWEIYTKYRWKWGHVKYGADWTVGQDYLNCVWANRDYWNGNGFKITDCTKKYNFCPATEKWGRKKAKHLVAERIKTGQIVTAHLKSGLKEMIYDGTLPDAVTRWPKGAIRWK
jgi:hypothetical protein